MTNINSNEHSILLNGVEITYIRKPAKRDTKHLIFVFSGFGATGNTTYDWKNVLLTSPAEIIWIKDLFEGFQCYYLCSKGHIENAVIKFMKLKLEEQNLRISDCTIMGASKGGASAIYYAMKYDFKNLIASVPQFFIGSYLATYWPNNFKNMTYGMTALEERKFQSKLDLFIPNAIKEATLDKNIYLITSHSDKQYHTEIEPNLHLLQRFENFNLIFSDSDLITRHNQVTAHTVSIATSLANLLSKGLPPKFNNQMVTYRSKKSEGPDYLKPLYELKKIYIENWRLFLEGYAIIQGMPCPEYTDLSYQLILKNSEASFKTLLAKGNKPNLNNEIGLKSNTAYYKGWFCTLKYAGISLDDLPRGKWQVLLEINVKGVINVVPFLSNTEINISAVNNAKNFSIYTVNKNLFFNFE